MNNDELLFYSQMPKIFYDFNILDSVDHLILARIYNTQNEMLPISVKELCEQTGFGKKRIIRSLKKLEFTNLLKVIPNVNKKGYNSTPTYKANRDRTSWVLTTLNRKLLNYEEEKKRITISKGADFQSYDLFFIAFEDRLSNFSLRYYLDDKGSELPNLKKDNDKQENKLKALLGLPLTKQEATKSLEAKLLNS